ncbi:MAG: hypothetical protein QM520_02820 [Gammaproteobacteria bacterium]|nr:hypothetical protein [Gammaproteobacteria bacterium]
MKILNKFRVAREPTHPKSPSSWLLLATLLISLLGGALTLWVMPRMQTDEQAALLLFRQIENFSDQAKEVRKFPKVPTDDQTWFSQLKQSVHLIDPAAQVSLEQGGAKVQWTSVNARAFSEWLVGLRTYQGLSVGKAELKPTLETTTWTGTLWLAKPR